MGCAFVTNNSQIKVNEVDINGEVTKSHKNDLNITNILEVKFDDISIVNECNLKKLDKPKKPKNKSKIKHNGINVKKKNKSSNNIEYNFSGPIITLLKNKVDNYQRKNF